MTQTHTVTLRATLDPSPGGPKLLIKISDKHTSIEHLAEVSLVSDACSRLTIVGLYAGLGENEVIISDRLAAAMEISDGDKVMLTTSSLKKDSSPPKTRAPVRHSPVVKPVDIPHPPSSVLPPSRAPVLPAPTVAAATVTAATVTAATAGTTTLAVDEKRGIGNLLLDPVNVSQGIEPAVSRTSLVRKIRNLVPAETEAEDLVDTEIGRTVGSLVDLWLVGDLTCRQLCVEVADLLEAKISDKKEVHSPISTLIGGRPNLAVAEDLMKEVFTFRTREEIFEHCVASLAPKFAQSTSQFLPDGNRFVHACNGNFRRLHVKLSDEMRLEILKAALRLVKGGRAEEGTSTLLTDREVLEELECDEVVATHEMGGTEKLENFNARMDVYLLRLLRLKATAVDQVANLQELGAYAVLGLNFGASEAEVRKAYKKLSLLVHPDKGGNTEMFQQLTEAYDRVLNSLGVKKTVTQEEEVGNRKNSETSEATKSARDQGERETRREEDEESETAGDERHGDEEEELWEVVRGVVLAAQKAALMASEGLEMSQLLSETLPFDKSEIRKNFQACMMACSAAVQAVSLVGMGALEAAKLALEVPKFKNPDCIAAVTEVSEYGVETLNAALGCRRDLEVAENEKRVAFAESEMSVLKNIGRRVALGVGEAVRKALETAKVCEDLYRWKTLRDGTNKEDKRRQTALDQRRQNVELLRRLNAELLAFQDQINDAISKNQMPTESASSSTKVTLAEKTSVFLLLRDYLFQSCVRLARENCRTANETIEALQNEAAFACLFNPKNTRLAVPISAAVRTLRLATVTDAEMTRRLVLSALIDPLKSTLNRAEAAIFKDEVLRKFFN